MVTPIALRPVLAAAGCLTALLGLSGAAWAADCITPDQVKTGLHVEYQSGAGVEVRLLPNGLIELRELDRAEGGGDLRYLSRFGVYDLEASLAADGDNATEHRVIYDYGGLPLPEPASGGTAWVGPVTVRFPDGQTEAQTAAYVFGSDQSVDLGGCSYDAVTVDATFLRTNGWEGQKFLFFPDLGFATLVGRSGPDQDKTDFPITAMRPVQG